MEQRTGKVNKPINPNRQKNKIRKTEKKRKNMGGD